MSLPSKLPYSPLVLSEWYGADMLIEDVGRAGVDDGRPAAGLLAGRRAAGRDCAAVALGRRDEVDLEVELVGVSGFAALAVVLRALAEVVRVVVRDVGVDAARPTVVGRVAL